MNAVGKLQSTGVSSKIKIARPYPAPCTICSVPYVPPDTMKNVAATRGQSVSLAILFFAWGIAWEGSWAGSDSVLNFYSRSSWSERSLSPNAERLRIRRIQGPSPHATTKCSQQDFFSIRLMELPQLLLTKLSLY